MTRLEKLREVAEDLNVTMKLKPTIDIEVESAKELKQNILKEMGVDDGQLYKRDVETLKPETWEYLTDTLGIDPRDPPPSTGQDAPTKSPKANKKEEEKVATKKKAAAKKKTAPAKKKAAPAKKKVAPKKATSSSLDGKITILNKEPRFKEGSIRSKVFGFAKDGMTANALIKKATKLDITEAQMKGHIKKLLVIEAIKIS